MKKYNLQLNIGLAVSERFNIGQDTISPAKALSALFKVDGLELTGFRLEQSASEPTAVIKATWTGDVVGNGDDFHLKRELKALSDTLGQDCIAVWNETDKLGVLIGEHSDLWGAFDPQYFIKFD